LLKQTGHVLAKLCFPVPNAKHKGKKSAYINENQETGMIILLV